MNEEKLKSFGSKIAALINKQHLTHQEAKEMFHQVLSNEQTELQQGAFLAALTAKGETTEEIAAAWEAIYEVDTIKVTPQTPTPIVDNCGTGMDTFKTFNISSAAAVVAAAGGVYMAKHGARALTSACGAVDILEAVGINVESDVNTVSRSIEIAGIGIFNGMSGNVHPQALFRILSQIRFGTTLNISASLANPALPRYAVRGVYRLDMVEPVARVMREIGYKKAIICHGLNGKASMDEFSTLGETSVAELDEIGEISIYTVSPEDFGITKPNEESLRPAASIKQEAISFLRILAGQDQGPKFDIVCLNAAPIFHLMGLADNLQGGFKMAQEIIESGRTVTKLRDWVKAQNTEPEHGLIKLDQLLAEIKAPQEVH